MLPAEAARASASPAIAAGLDLPALRRRARELIIDMAATPTGCHLGGSLSVVDILIAAYVRFGRREDDQIILSKGHAVAALYAVLHLFDYIDDPVPHYGRAGQPLTGHPNPSVPGVRFATGSLGHGVALALGWAAGQRLRGRAGIGLAIAGDGELQEGLTWEAFQLAQAKRLGNYMVIVDCNGGQNDGAVASISALPRLPERFAAFGFRVAEVDGHDVAALLDIIDGHNASGDTPLAVLAKTVKGKGVTALEGKYESHYKVIDAKKAETWKRSLR